MKTSYANTSRSLHPTTSSVLLPSTPSTTVLGLQSLYSRPKQVVGHRKPAFTIVELLIVIVVIGILATISIIAYTGITQKAKNTAIINAASQSLRMIEAYVAQYGEYPETSGVFVCITHQSGCLEGSGISHPSNATFNAQMALIGNLPQSVPNLSDTSKRIGIRYRYQASLMVADESLPATLSYWLEGLNQNCGIASGVLNNDSTPSSFSTTGYTSGNAGGAGDKTYCRISIPGPAS